MAGEGQFDVHSSGGFTLEFNLDSSSSSFLLYHICSNTVYLTNVPVPASNLREWKFVKTSTYFLIYCDGIYVGSMSQSDQCFSDSKWNSFLGRGLNFCCGDVVTKEYRIVPSEYTVALKVQEFGNVLKCWGMVGAKIQIVRERQGHGGGWEHGLGNQDAGMIGARLGHGYGEQVWGMIHNQNYVMILKKIKRYRSNFAYAV